MRKKLEGRLVIATHNAGKLWEMRELLAPYGLDAVSAGDLGLPEPEETGETFHANAELKALGAAQAAGLPALADDSGVCVVDALGGAPGLYSARWAEVAPGGPARFCRGGNGKGRSRLARERRRAAISGAFRLGYGARLA